MIIEINFLYMSGVSTNHLKRFTSTTDISRSVAGLLAQLNYDSDLFFDQSDNWIFLQH